MKVLVNGQLIEYKKEGKGKTVLLLHGWGSSLGTFDELAAYFIARGNTVFRFDFPGFGGSPAPLESWSVSDYVTITAAFLQKMKIKQLAVLGGHSFGGRVIIKGVATGELDAYRVLLMGAAGIKAKPTLKKAAFTAIAKTGKVVTALPGFSTVREKMREKLYSAAGNTDYLQAGPLQKTFLNTIREDLSSYLSDVAIPATLIWGERDTETPPADGIRMERELQHAQLTVVPNAGHFVHQDALKQVTEILDTELR